MSAVLTIPMTVAMFMVEVIEEMSPESSVILRFVSALLSILGTALFVYIFATLKALLGARYEFHDVDGLISTLIIVSISVAGLGIIGDLFAHTEAAIGGIILLATLSLGVVYIVFAMKLLRLKGDLYGMLKPFSYLSIGMGFCFFTVVLIPITILMSAITDIILAIIFFRAVDAPELAA